MDDYRRNSFADTLGVIGTMLIGAVIGAAVALLVAPKSGQELRDDLRSGANRVSEEISEVSQRATENVRSQVQKIGEKAEQIGARVGSKAEQLGDDAERASKQV